MSSVSRIALVVAATLILGGALITFLAPAKQQPTLGYLSSEVPRSAGEFDVIVGDETPFTPEW